MSAAPSISIVIPTYNYGRFLDRAFGSIVAQSQKPAEIVVVDDGSTDDTAEIVAAWRSRFDIPLRYRRQENAGPSAARNRGAELATGTHLLFLDADDELFPDAVAAFERAAQEHPEADLLIAGHRRIREDGKPRDMPAPEPVGDARADFADYVLHRRRLNFQIGAALFRRDVFATLRFPEELRYAEDFTLFAWCLALKRVISVPVMAVTKHRHEASISHDWERMNREAEHGIKRLFDPAILPAELMRFYGGLAAYRHLDLFNLFWSARAYGPAVDAFHRALRHESRVVLSYRNLSRYLRARLRR
jgi:glycosyltransferase involved in cell wall biosynthesis